MASRIGLCAALLAATALAACGGGSGGGSEDDGPTSGLPSPDDIVDASPDFINSLNSELAIINSQIVRTGRLDLPATGSATYSGFGTIFDASLTTADTSAAQLRNRWVVTDVDGRIDFRDRTLTITQDRFRDVGGNRVSGEATWTTTYVDDGLFDATVTGNVGGTSFATGTNQAQAGFYGNVADSAIVGVFSNAPASGGGWLRGTRVSGDIAATSD